MLETMFGSKEREKTIKVKCLVVDALSPYSSILGRLTLNLVEEVLSTLHLSLKYLLPDGRVGLVSEDQHVTHECYKNNLEMKKGTRYPICLPLARSTRRRGRKMGPQTRD